MPDPIAQFGDDSKPDTRPIYGYIIRQLTGTQPPICLTGHDGEFSISGIPSRYETTNPQTFSVAAISHGPIRREGNFDKSTFEVNALTRDINGISLYTLTGALPRLAIDIIKVSPAAAEDGTAVWNSETFVVQTGIVSGLSFRGFAVTVECTPEPLFSNHEIPTWRFSRTCNRMLYSPGCAVSKSAFDMAATITAIDIQNRRITVNDSYGADGTHFNWFKHGMVKHNPSGLLLSVRMSENIPTNKTLLTLHQWNPDIQVGDAVVCYPGCNHTFVTCRDKFSNAQNFGGFSEVPNKNPAQHGVK